MQATTSATSVRTRKAYPPPDRSKCYDSVPPRTIVPDNFFVRHYRRIGCELGIFIIDPIERYGAIVVMILLALVAMAIPIYAAKYAISALLL